MENQENLSDNSGELLAKLTAGAASRAGEVKKPEPPKAEAKVEAKVEPKVEEKAPEAPAKETETFIDPVKTQEIVEPEQKEPEKVKGKDDSLKTALENEKSQEKRSKEDKAADKENNISFFRNKLTDTQKELETLKAKESR